MSPRYPRPAALPDPLPRRLVLDASAGTGKTFTLEHLVVDLLLGGLRIEQILVVTYTEKAAAEMRERIRKLLARLLANDFQQAAPGEPAWDLGPEAARALDRARMHFDRATITTIHSFCQRLLKETAFLSGQTFGAELADGDELFQRSAQECLRRRWAVPGAAAYGRIARTLESLHGEEAFARLLNKVRKEAGQRWPDDPDPAGAARRAQAAFRHLDLEALLAALEVKGSSRASLRAQLDELLTACGQQAWAQVQAALDDLLFSRNQGPRKLLGLLGPAGQRHPEGRAALEALMDLHDALPSPEAEAVDAFLPDVLERLDAMKAEMDLLDFDDMIRRVARSLEDPATGPLLLALLQSRYQAALIDEFQDTDPVQWGIFHQVFGQHGRLVLIGDPKQAIYGFRGTDVHTYLAARNALVAAGAPVVDLARNFRSTPRMVAACNAILDQQAEAPFFTFDAIRYDVPVQAGKPGLRWVDPAEPDRDLPPIRLVPVLLEGSVTKPRVQRLVARALAREVRALLERGPELRDGTGPFRAALKPEDVFVLTRDKDESNVMAEALRQAGVPATFFKQEGVFQSPEALELLNVLRAVADPSDPVRRLKAWLTPVFGAALGDLGRTQDLPETHPFLGSLLAWHDLARKGDYPALFRELVDGGLLRRLLRTRGDDRAAGVWLQLTEFMLEQCTTRRGGFEAAVAFLADCIEGRASLPGEDTDVHRVQTDRSAVQILTMHKSKGLEAKVVVLFGGWSRKDDAPVHRFILDGRRRYWLGAKPSPALAARVDQATEAEDQRLLYVALTRAQAQLILPVFQATAAGVASKGIFHKATGDPLGAYGTVNRRLRALLPQADPALFQAVELPAAPPPSLAPLRPPEPDLPLPPPPDPARLARLAQAAAPPRYESYTSLSRDLHEHAPADPEDHPPAAAVRLALPGGAATGICLHTILESVPHASALEAQTREAWQRRPEVARALDTALAAAGLAPRHRDPAALLAWHALRTPFDLPGGGVLPELGALTRLLRETGFLMHRPRGPHYLEGAIDLLFEWQGRTCFLDWKTNVLPRYRPEDCTGTLRTHYALQFAIYTLAVCAFLDITDEAAYEARFGGGLYVFLRGLPEGGQAALRPAWAQVQAWSRALQADREEDIRVD